MRIQLTTKMSVSEKDICRLTFDPYSKTIDKLRNDAIKMSADAYVERHRMILTLQTLPDDIYDKLPKGDHLHYLDESGRIATIELKRSYPQLKGLVGGGYGGFSNKSGYCKVTDLFAACPEAQAMYESTKPIEERYNKAREELEEYLNAAGFQSVPQLTWSAPELVSTILHMHAPQKRWYAGQRRNSDTDNFLAKISDRRYLAANQKRRPKIVKTLPSHLLPYFGESKLLFESLKKEANDT